MRGSFAVWGSGFGMGIGSGTGPPDTMIIDATEDVSKKARDN